MPSIVSFHVSFERIVLEFLSQIGLEHFFPFLVVDQAAIHGIDNLLFLFLHVLSDEHQALLSVPDILSLRLLLQSKLRVNYSLPRDGALNLQLDGGLTPHKVGVRVV